MAEIDFNKFVNEQTVDFSKFKTVDFTQPNIQTSVEQAPGFFETLRNPLDLWTWESLPVAAYQWLSGNTKQKQATESAKWLKDNQYYNNINDTEEYQYHEKVMRLYGHTLDETPFSMSALKQALKSIPGMFGGELFNALVINSTGLLVECSLKDSLLTLQTLVCFLSP